MAAKSASIRQESEFFANNQFQHRFLTNKHVYKMLGMIKIFLKEFLIDT
jgi:hypothetical protein